MKRAATAAEKRHMGRVAALGCILCDHLGLGATPAQVHHIREGQGMSQRANDYLGDRAWSHDPQGTGELLTGLSRGQQGVLQTKQGGLGCLQKTLPLFGQ